MEVFMEIVSAWLSIAAFIGYIASYIYEKMTITWHGKDLKQWIFVFLCLLIGFFTAIGTGNLVFTPLAWGSAEAILISIVHVLEWAVAIGVAGFTAFNTLIHNPKSISQDTLTNIKETSKFSGYK